MNEVQESNAVALLTSIGGGIGFGLMITYLLDAYFEHHGRNVLPQAAEMPLLLLGFMAMVSTVLGIGVAV